MDRLDAKEKLVQEYAAFRLSFAAVRQQLALFDEIERVAPKYLTDLERSIDEAMDQADEYEERQGMPPRSLSVQDSADDSSFAMARKDAELLLAQLFPPGFKSRNLRYAFLGSALVAMHSALEKFAVTLGVAERGKFVDNISAWLRSKGIDLPYDLGKKLIDIDATRHVLAHNGGIVDDRYIETVAGSNLRHGERRPLSLAFLLSCSDECWSASLILLKACQNAA